MKRYLIAASIALISASPGLAQTAAEYVMKAGAGDLYEKQSSQLVLKTTKDPKVRDFAQMMVTDHTKSTADVKVAAQASGLTPKPPALDAKKSAMIADLTKATGPARDKVYLTQQKAAHQEALALHQGYSSIGDKPALKAAAGKIVPVVQHHIEMLSSMK